MNIYPADFEVKLGFDQIRNKLSSYCLGPLAEKEVNSISFSTRADEIRELLLQCWEFKKVLEKGGNIPLTHYADPTIHFDVIRIEGSFLEEENFLEILPALQSILGLLQYFRSSKEEYPELYKLTIPVNLSSQLVTSVLSKFNEKGKIRDTASQELARLRKRLREEEIRVRKLTEQIFQDSVKQNWVPEGAMLTVREGRVVVPVLAEHKRKLHGFIQDESSTGQTVYIEPVQSMEANNEIRDLRHAERREEVRILKELTALLRGNLEGIESACYFLGKIDFNHAKAKLSIELEANLPEILDQPCLNWILARHPLLHVSLKRKRNLVPLTIDLPSDSRFLLISGPNAGGKSVCLKTVGLIQYMLQCGLLVPLDEKSKVGIFKNIFLDIGDQQSIENDLSTYSSHLKNMDFFLTHADSKTLVLVDELGAGTDPNFGGGIAEAILDELLQRNVWGLATTHYYNLKVFAANRSEIRNGSMQFDTKNLEPLFCLDIGKPGSSFALEIARKAGLPKSTIEKAEQIIGKELTGLEMLMKSVAEEKQQLQTNQREFLERENKLDREKQQYQKLWEELNARKKEIIDRAKLEAATLLKETNREIEKTIRHIRENRAEKKETRKVRQGLGELAEKVQPQINTISPPSQRLKEGDKVRLIGQEVTGTLVSIKDKQAVVEFGSARTTVKLIQLVRSDLIEPTSISRAKSMGLDVLGKQSAFVSTLDLRGKRAEEVGPELDRFLDDAILLSQGELKILHGKGEGVLRKIVRERLKSIKQVASFGDEHVERGGDGITVVVLK